LLDILYAAERVCVLRIEPQLVQVAGVAVYADIYVAVLGIDYLITKVRSVAAPFVRFFL
jgi:hypothetical protein